MLSVAHALLTPANALAAPDSRADVSVLPIEEVALPTPDVTDFRDVVDAINRLCDTMKTSYDYEASVVAETWVDSELVNPEEVTVRTVETLRADNWTDIPTSLTDWVEDTRNEQSVTSDEQPITLQKQLMTSDEQLVMLKETSVEQPVKSIEQFVTSDENPVKSNKQLVTSNEQLVKSNKQLVTSDELPVKSNKQLVTSDEQPVKWNKQLVTSGETLIKSHKELVTSDEQPVKSNKQLVTSDEQPVKSNEQLVAFDEQAATSNDQFQMLQNQLMTINEQLTTSNEQQVTLVERSAAHCDQISEYYTVSSDVSIVSELEMAERCQDDSAEKEGKECVMAGHVAAMRERFESMTRVNTPCPELARSLSPSLELFRTTPSPDGLA